MDYVSVKGLDKPVSSLVLGTAWADSTKQAHFNSLLDYYVANGGNTIDTARFYGVVSDAQDALRVWLKDFGKREDVIIIDKCCHPFQHRDKRKDEWRPRVSPEFITDDLAYCLDRVGTDYFDLFLLHRDNVSVPVADLMDRMERHRKEGLIKAYGVSNWTLPRIREAVEYCEKMGYQGLSVDSPSYSLATVTNPRWPNCVYINDEEAWAHGDLDVSIMSWASQASGFFTGLFDQDNAPAFMKETYFSEENFEKLRRAKELSEIHGVSPINIALAYILNQPVSVAAIVGPANVDELDSCLRAVDIKLSKNELDYLGLYSQSL